MKKQTLLNYILATVIVVLLFYIRTSADYPADPPLSQLVGVFDATCHYADVTGFAPAIEVPKEDAQTQATEYQTAAASRNDTILGGVISKAALDLLLCGGKYNGLAYRLAMDKSGKHGPKNAVFIIVGGVEVKEVDKDQKIVAQSSTFYTNNLWCPPSCMSFQ